MFCLPPLFTAHFCPCPTIQKAIILCTDERKSYGLAFILQCIASGHLPGMHAQEKERKAYGEGDCVPAASCPCGIHPCTSSSPPWSGSA